MPNRLRVTSPLLTTTLRLPPLVLIKWCQLPAARTSEIKYLMPVLRTRTTLLLGSVLQFEDVAWRNLYGELACSCISSQGHTYTLTRRTIFYGDSIIEISKREKFEWAFSQLKLCPFVPINHQTTKVGYINKASS